jgi:hypothetical protein
MIWLGRGGSYDVFTAELDRREERVVGTGAAARCDASASTGAGTEAGITGSCGGTKAGAARGCDVGLTTVRATTPNTSIDASSTHTSTSAGMRGGLGCGIRSSRLAAARIGTPWRATMGAGVRSVARAGFPRGGASCLGFVSVDTFSVAGERARIARHEVAFWGWAANIFPRTVSGVSDARPREKRERDELRPHVCVYV